jgi:hypothetical protein
MEGRIDAIICQQQSAAREPPQFVGVHAMKMSALVLDSA